ncbi:MAG: magnesium/cobalt transporter CorA [Cyclobacteriaceae bacterium]|nr:magnesium/cobalt transporter CorA [Cyclobacteriaceae bacterium]
MGKKRFHKPGKIIRSGVKSLTHHSHNLYAQLKSETKGKAEVSFIGQKKTQSVSAQLYQYNADKAVYVNNIRDFDFFHTQDKPDYLWLNFHGLHDVVMISSLADSLQLDRLTLRNILDTTQRPKSEEFEGYLQFSIKSILKKEDGQLQVEQISFILSDQYVISFQEESSDHFGSIRRKINEGTGSIRKKSSDYLLSQLLDALLDNYFESIDQVNQELRILESDVFKNPVKEVLIALENHKKAAQVIKKSLVPCREAIQSILNGRTRFIHDDNQKFFRDLSNNITSALDETEDTIRTLDGLTNIYFASESQKMNETMKLLTTVATLFIPLTFIAGIYGMNFTYMPGLTYPYGYYAVLVAMALVSILMIIFFKRKGLF